MAGYGWHNKRQTFPKKGTKLRALLLLLLRGQGLSANEAVGLGILKYSSEFGPRRDYLTDFYNFDIIQWNIKSPLPGRPRKSFRIIGRWREDGRYLDYLARKIK